MVDVVLVVMPMAGLDRPSLAAGLLMSELKGADVTCSTLYENIRFAEAIGEDVYDWVDSFPPQDLVGEWLFADEVFEKSEKIDSEYISEVLGGSNRWHVLDSEWKATASSIATLTHTKQLVHEFIVSAVDRILSLSPKIVGLTTTFQQNLACLAVCKRLKELAPQIVLVLGGANVAGEMGIEFLNSFDWVDAVCIGAGEGVFLKFVEGILRGSGISSVYPILAKGSPPENFFPLPKTMGRIIPDYEDYFSCVRSKARRGKIANAPVKIPVEGSRGCWWGMKKHCVFCGLNGEDLTYVVRPEQELIDEMKKHLRMYGDVTQFFFLCDNIIPMSFFKSRGVFDVLKRELPGISLFCETKGNLTSVQINRARSAGVHHWQPGVESLSDAILKLMGKGITAAQNICLLRNCLEEGIVPMWNYLVGFPNERGEDYQDQFDLFTCLHHLTPPCRGRPSPVRIDRFSPIFESKRGNPCASLFPYPSAFLVYRNLGQESLSRISYFFIDDSCHPVTGSSHWNRIEDGLSTWATGHLTAVNVFIDDGVRSVIFRGDAFACLGRVVLEGDERDLFLRLREPQSVERDSFESVAAPLKRLLDEKLVVKTGKHFVTVSLRFSKRLHLGKTVFQKLWSLLLDEPFKVVAGDSLTQGACD